MAGFVDPDEFKDPDTFIDPDTSSGEIGAGDIEAYKIPLASAAGKVDRFFTGLGIAGAGVTGNLDVADKLGNAQLEREKKRNKWANPKNQKTTLGADIAGNIATLPAQLLAFPFSPAETGQKLLEHGEDLSTALKGVGADTVGNMAGVLPAPGLGVAGRLAFGAGSNAAQEAAVSSYITSVAKTEGAKEEFKPTVRKAIVAGITGGALHGVMGERRKPVITKQQERSSSLTKYAAEKEAEKTYLDSKIKELNDKQAMLLEEQLINDAEQTRTNQQLQDPEQQMQLPFTNSVEDIAAVRSTRQEPIKTDGEPVPTSFLGTEGTEPRPLYDNANANQPDMFVDLERVNTQAALTLKATQDKLQSLLEKRKELTKEVDLATVKNEIGIAYEARQASSTQRNSLEQKVSLLQNKFQVPRGQRGAINMEMFKDDYIKIKQFRARDGNDYFMSVEGSPTDISVTISNKDGYQVADGIFAREKWAQDPSPSDFISANMISTSPEFQGKGLATSIYNTLSELGNDVVASKNQLPEGVALWDSFVKKGIAKTEGSKKIIPKDQRGSIDLEAIKNGIEILNAPVPIEDINKISAIKITDQSTIPYDPSARSVLTRAMEDNDGFPNRFFSAGAILEAQKTKSSLIKHVGQIVQNYGKRAELWQRKVVFPIEESFRKFNSSDLIDAHHISMTEFKLGSRFSPEELVNLGYSPKIIETHTAFRAAMDKSLELQNEARLAQGKPPITGEEAYYAARWKGAFGANISDSTGKVVWKLTAESRYGLGRQVAALLKKFPELKHQDTVVSKNGENVVVSKDFDRLNTKGMDKGSIDSAYSMMVDILGRKDPQVQALKQYMEENDTSMSRAVAGQEKHFIRKSGMRGFEGDRADIMSPEKNAKEFFKQQMQYMKNASRWTEINKSSDNLKAILTDENLIALQPNNVKYAREYVANSMGFGEAKLVRDLENNLAKSMGRAGVSPAEINSIVGTTKGLWVTSKLMFSLGYSVANAFQLFNTTPWMMDLINKGYGGGIGTTAGTGLIGGLALATGHMAKGVKFTDYVDTLSAPEFVKGALKYAENNSIANRSVYDESPIGTHNSLPWRIAKGTVTAPETVARSVAFMSFVGQLFSSGKFEPHQWNEMYQMAEEYTVKAMGDSRQTERAPIFSKMGIVGNTFNTLQTYPMNWFNQLSTLTREAGRGNPLPLFTMFVVQASVAGALGLPLVEDIHNMWEWIKKGEFIPSKVFVKIKDWNIKTALIDHLGETGAYGLPSVVSGYNMTSRLSTPTAQQSATIPGGMAKDILTQLGDISEAAIHVTDQEKWAQAVLSSSPPALKEFIAQTYLEEFTQTKPNKEGSVGVFSRKDIGSRISVHERTPEESSMARLGIRTQKETLLSDITYPVRSLDKEMRERRVSVTKKIYSELIRTGKFSDDNVKLFIALGGKDLNDSLAAKAKLEFVSALGRQGEKASGSLNGVLQYNKVMRILKENGYAPP